MAIALPKLTILSSVLMTNKHLSAIDDHQPCKLRRGLQTVVKRLSNGGMGVKDLQTGVQIAGHGFLQIEMPLLYRSLSQAV